MNNEIKSLVDYALEYAALGWSVIPVGQNKKPLIEWKEYQTKRADVETIKKWWKEFPNANIGVVTGSISGIVVVDVEAGGTAEDLPATVISKTGGGGWHFIYKHPGQHIKNAVRIKPKTDIRADGGYVVLPPSLHKSGNRYEWLVSPKDSDFAELPRWVLEGTKSEKEKKDWPKILTSEISQGERNMTAAQVAGKLLFHLPTELWEITGLPMLKLWNEQHNRPPLAESELKTTWESIRKAEIERRAQLSVAKPKEMRTPISFEQLEEITKKWLLIADTGIIRIIAATVIANKFIGDPVWLFIVAASGGTKTELIRGLNQIGGIYPISDLTPQTFLSGERGNQNASLLLRLPRYGTILTYKDFTTVLKMHRDKSHAILAQLREIYDGYYKKEFGTGETRAWEGKLGFIAGVTAVIDHYQSVFQVLGERFIFYRPTQVDTIADTVALAKRAMANSGGEKLMRKEIENAFADFLAGVQIPDVMPQVPDTLKDKIAHLATFCVRARSGVIREGFSSREIELIPNPELPTRLAKTLVTLMSALLLIEDTSVEEAYGLIFKTGMDTLSQKRKRVLEVLIANNEKSDTSVIAEAIGYPTNTTRRELEELHGLGLIRKEHGGQGKADKWFISEYTSELLEKAASDSLRTENPQKSTSQDTLPEMSDATTILDKTEICSCPTCTSQNTMSEKSEDLIQKIDSLFDEAGSATSATTPNE